MPPASVSSRSMANELGAAGPSAASKQRAGLLDAQKLLASIALSRPTPFGAIPHRGSSQSSRSERGRGAATPSPSPSSASSTQSIQARRASETSQTSPAFDVRLSEADALDCSISDTWPRRESGGAGMKGKGRAYLHPTTTLNSEEDGLFPSSHSSSSPTSPVSPEEEWEAQSNATSTHARSHRGTSSRSRESTSPSTPASSRSSSLRRKPSLLGGQCPSPPTSSSQAVAANGRSSIPTLGGGSGSRMARTIGGKESQSLAERGSLAEVAASAMPSLYTMSRGRSAHVSPSRRWDRRGASASVLCGPPFHLQDSTLVQPVNGTVGLASEREAAYESAESVNATLKARTGSAGSLEAALFSSDDDAELFAPSDEEDEMDDTVVASQAASRRSSVDRERRRELRVLLAPSTSQESSSGSNGRSCSHSLATVATAASDELGSSQDRLSTGGMSLMSGLSSPTDTADTSTSRMLERKRERSREGLLSTAPASTTADLADDESEGTVDASAASLLDRRSRSGRRLHSSVLKSISPVLLPPLDAIPSGMTPDEKAFGDVFPNVSAETVEQGTDIDDTNRLAISPSSVGASATVAALVEAESDPLLGPSFGSVADNMQVDAVEWNDASSRKGSIGSAQPSPTASPRPGSSISGRMTLAEQEAERRTGFAAAYQNRIAALSMRLWTPGKNARDAAGPDAVEASKQTQDAKDKQDDAGQESLLSSGWRHLTSLPNFLLMPTLGGSAAAAKGPTGRPGSRDGRAASVSTTSSSLKTLPANEEAAAKIKRGDALNAAQVAVAHLSHRHGADRTTAAVGRSLEALPQAKRDASLSPETNSPADIDASPQPVRRTASEILPPNRSGRGVMTPLEADADISAYVSGLGLPIDPDVELSSVVHLQTFRSDSRARRATSASRERPTDLSPNSQHRRTLSDSQPTPPAVMSLSAIRQGPGAVSSDVESDDRTAAKPRRQSPPSQRKPRASERASAAATPRCSRPAVSEPVPGDFSAYKSPSDEEHSHSSGAEEGADSAASDTHRPRLSKRESDESDHASRGRGRGSRRRRSTSPESHQQCAIGLFSSNPTSLSRTRSGGKRRANRTSAADAAKMASVLRARSSPDLTALNVHVGDVDDAEQQRMAASKAVAQGVLDEDDDADDDEERIYTGARRGRGDGVKRVSASVMSDRVAGLPPNRRLVNGNGTVMRRSVSSTAIMANAVGGADMDESAVSAAVANDASPVTGDGHSSSQHVIASTSNTPISSSNRLPIVGADSIIHLAGRPSMVSNGAHLLMLSLELEMMRNRKITGSLKPRWLKARMRTEPFGPAALVAMMAEQRASQRGRESSTEGSREDETAHSDDEGGERRGRMPHPAHGGKHTGAHEHRAHIGLHTSAPHHRANAGHRDAPHHASHRRMKTSASTLAVANDHATRPRRGSALRFEVTVSSGSSTSG